VPRLVERTGQRHVEADLDDLVARSQHPLAHPRDPRVGGDLPEAAQPLRVDLDVVPPWSPAQRAVRRADGLLEEDGEVVAELGGPFAAERALLAGDAIGLERLLDRGDVESLHDRIVPL
jgi:hypothetical protein